MTKTKSSIMLFTILFGLVTLTAWNVKRGNMGKYWDDLTQRSNVPESIECSSERAFPCPEKQKSDKRGEYFDVVLDVRVDFPQDLTARYRVGPDGSQWISESINPVRKQWTRLVSGVSRGSEVALVAEHNSTGGRTICIIWQIDRANGGLYTRLNANVSGSTLIDAGADCKVNAVVS